MIVAEKMLTEPVAKSVSWEGRIGTWMSFSSARLPCVPRHEV
jgi:hypothetical protein